MSEPVRGDGYELWLGDCMSVLPRLGAESCAACLCDPPYGYAFMGKHWDHGVPSAEIWREVWRVLKPGAVLMAFGGTRTWHRLAVNIEDAGFEMVDTIEWVYGSGFPKSQDIGKAIDKEAGAEREVIGQKVYADGKPRTMGANDTMHDGWQRPWRVEDPQRGERLTAPATDAARTWQGYGTALKPAHEPILVFRKPRRGTYAQTAVEHGAGALNVDGCRIATARDRPLIQGDRRNGNNTYGEGLCGSYHAGATSQGRWPANIIFDQEAAAVLDEMSGELTSGKPNGATRNASGPFLAHANGVDLTGYGDTGGASRFFKVLPAFIYEAKAATSERNEGLDGMTKSQKYNKDGQWNSHSVFNGESGSDEWRAKNPAHPQANIHPTVKPLSLCEYLARLIVPPKEYRTEARLLVPFSGSGSEMIGALMAGWRNVVGIEIEREYVEIAAGRIADAALAAAGKPKQLRGRAEDYDNLPLLVKNQDKSDE